ncbi:protein kinase C and casein kinase substrate in neurons protein 1 isoform X1 [Ixodes scapularis]|nr:protein kinase C and casein kinase substrate in neurons protein 1 isoform X1 [Ixodes scapularis]XP_040069223.1 protein kinase C and casein kinase substrate in neurons protein 1 isoform X1 [Ixodes scapularis]XP_040079188.1 protein kinase C and casein kinase substrate in neurons protein 1 isoform X1 [Ixodes scapularis]XP_040079189.1 protein kinase C and casein kinase substrate in neurons protein 1 isoform X1 [Ixodes scapularis]
MSHHSDEALLVAGSESFWEPGNYKRTSKRTEDGHRLCSDLVQLVQERSEVEKAYAKGLRAWARKWADLIDKGPEYGTTEAAWKGALLEAERTCEMHLRVRDRLLNDVVPQVKGWQKENFHRSMMQLRERRELDEAFKKAQKPWAKLLAKVDRSRTDYHAACKGERSATNQERNAGADTSLSPDQVKKLQDRVQRCKEEVQRTRERYEASLQEINEYNAKYMEDMTVVFDKCQEFEQRRLHFFKEMLFGIHACLNISTDPELPQIYEEYRHTIQNADASKDLKWWSNNHGVGMAMNWPQFEEYSEEFRDIVGKSKKAAIPESGITLVNQHKIGEELPEYTPEVQQIHRKEKKALDAGGITLTSVSTRADGAPVATAPKAGSGPKRDKDVKDGGTASNHAALNARNNPSANNNNTNGRGGEANPFDEDHEDWDEESNDALVDTGEPGVPVRALYDYEGAEADELSFKQGDQFEKLEDEDEQGWCKGRKDGRVGLYPANYVEVVP